jgi:non-homologous end joining protein Ku
MRPIWSGTISFGLVSVPVRMFPATESKELRFHFLHKKDLSPQALDGDLGTAKLQKAEVEMAKSLVENLSEPFKPEKYDDQYRKELLELIRAKAEGQPLPEPQQKEEGEVVDLMAALRESVERTKKQRRRTSKRKAS